MSISMVAGLGARPGKERSRSYAHEVNHLPGMSSDVLRGFGKASELWWRVMGVPATGARVNKL